MNENLFFEPSLQKDSTSIHLNPEESHHISRVLRRQTGDHLKLLNGRGLLANSIISEISKKEIILSITSTELFPAPGNSIHLAFSPVKKRDKNEWIVEKATELGVSKISFFKSSHSERVVINQDRFEKICISAIKQSGNPFKPDIQPLQEFKALINSLEHDVSSKLIAYCGTTSSQFISKQYLEENNSIILIGPEGGFSEEEVTYAIGKGFAPINLGKYRLRTETAAVFAVSAIKTLKTLA